MKKYLLIIPILITFIILNSCKDEVAPTDCGCVKIVYDTTTFDLSGSVGTLNKFDERNYLGNYPSGEYKVDGDSIKVTLYKNDIIINEKFTSYHNYNFDKLDKKASYRIKFEKEGYLTIENNLLIRNYERKKSFDMEIVRNYDILNVYDSIFQPYEPPKIKSITGKLYPDSTYHGDGISTEYYHRLYFLINFNEPRRYQKAIISLSTEPNFEQSKCIIFNEEMKPKNDITIHSGNMNSYIPTFKKGDKVYIRAYPIKNGTVRYKDSKELGEPVYYELEAK